MAKRKNINGTVYSPKKHNLAYHCFNCHRLIESFTLSYEVGNSAPAKIMCATCVNKLFAQYQIERDKNISAYSREIPLYIGTKHSCGKQTFESIPFYFTNENKTKKLSVKKCPRCNEHFIDDRLYRQNLFYFDEYKMYDPITKKQLARIDAPLKPITWDKTTVSREIPYNVRWAVTHPYQGGNCSGK